MHKETIKLLTGRPGAPIPLLEGLATAYGNPRARMTRLGIAYVSNSGLDLLFEHLTPFPSWNATQKKWIVSPHHGITEPAALERLLSDGTSEVRLLLGGTHLSRETLAGREVFHAKIICVSSGGGPASEALCLLITSSNLTTAAVGRRARNYEAGVSLGAEYCHRNLYDRFQQWWHRAWHQSAPLTQELLSRYAQLRNQFLLKNPGLLAGVPPPSPSHVTRATTLWIDAGAMSGGSRNQVEFNSELAEFFAPPQRGRRLLRLRANQREWADRPLSHKTTTFGVDIWRLSLPTTFDYPQKVIRFKKRTDQQGTYFQVDIAEHGDRRHSQWRALSHRRGYVGMTSGQRAYGFY